MLVPIFLEPHEICAEQNTGEAVWRKTPAGDEAAVACPADASGTIKADASFVCLVFFSLSLFGHQLLSVSIMPLTNKHFLRKQA